MVNSAQLIRIVGVGKTNIVNRLIEPINDCLLKYDISSKLRICHFLAQVLHESGGLYYFEEIASGAAYEGRLDLGNVNKGDGIKYKGRGLIQITGAYNYSKISKDLGVDFVNQPELLSTDKYGVLSAGWFWGGKNLNLLADQDNLELITRKVNGGLNGLSNRKIWLDKCKSVI